MKRKLAILLSFIILASAFTLVPPPLSFAADFSYAGLVNSTTGETPYKYVEKLISKEFRGRGLGDIGERNSAEWIADQFKTFGLKPAGDEESYYQWFETPVWIMSALDFRLFDDNDAPLTQFVYKKDYNLLMYSGSGKVKSKPVFVGFGITIKDWEYDDYAGVDVKGKVVVMFRHAPTYMRERFKESPQYEGVMSFNNKILLAKKNGASGIVFIENPSLPPNYRNNLTMKASNASPLGLPGVFAAVETGDFLLKPKNITCLELFKSINEAQAPKSFEIGGPQVSIEVNGVYEPKYKARNVVGYIPASDPFGANETLVIGAHYDHLGTDIDGVMYPGACDNASGTAVMMEIARAFTTASVKPKSNICFVAFTGEESGLVGSGQFAALPPFPLDGMTMLNLDMVCADTNSMAVIMDTGYSDLYERIKFASNKLGVNIVQGNIASNNDAFPFHARGVPSVFFFTRGYMKWHTADDTIEYVHKEGLQMASRFASLVTALYTDPFYLAIDNASEKPLEFEAPETTITGYTGKGARVSIGGRSMIASETGRFVIPIVLSPGENTLKVTAVKASTGEKIEREIKVNYVQRPTVVLSSQAINFGYVAKNEAKTFTFTITNGSQTPLEGKITPCSDWMKVTPNTLNKDKTQVVATILPNNLKPSGFNICMIELDTNAGPIFIPVTAVTGEKAEIVVETKMNDLKPIIQGDPVPVKIPAQVIGEVSYFPANLLSMAFGASFAKTGDKVTIGLNGKTIRMWTGSNVALIDNTPVLLEATVHEKDGQLLVPGDILEENAVEIEVIESEDQPDRYTLTLNLEPVEITVEVDNWKGFEIDPTKPLESQSVTFNLSSDSPVFVTINPGDYFATTTQMPIELSEKPVIVTFHMLTAKIVASAPKDGTTIIGKIEFKPDYPAIFKPAPSSSAVAFKTSENGFVFEPKILVGLTHKNINMKVGSEKMIVDGEERTTNPPPMVIKGYTMVPLRAIADAFGSTISYMHETKKIIIKGNGKIIELTVNSKKAKINGVETTLVAPAIVQAGRSLVPIRFISEAFGAKVDWEAATKKITITYAYPCVPLLKLDKKSIIHEWLDASKDTQIPSSSVNIGNACNTGSSLTINKVHFDKSIIEVTNSSKMMTIKSVLTQKPTITDTSIIVESNGGTDAIKVNSSVYPSDWILASGVNQTYTLNGTAQTDKPQLVEGLYSTSLVKLISSASGSVISDSTTGIFTIVFHGKTLTLNTTNGDVFVDDEKKAWDLAFTVKNEDIIIPWALLSLAFDLEIIDDNGKVTMLLPKEKPEKLSLNMPSIDLVKLNNPYFLQQFTADMYPLKKGKKYESPADNSKFKLFFFVNATKQSAQMIPYIESVKRRFENKDLNALLVYTGLVNDYSVESFFAGNADISDGLEKLSLVGFTLPIIFDSGGMVCKGFPGVASPRLYIVSDEKLIFSMPDINPSQLMLLEQALSSIISGQSYLPPDVFSATVTNLGGKAGNGTLTSANPLISIPNTKFSKSPSQISMTFNPDIVKTGNAVKMEKTTLTLLSPSSQSEIPVRCWVLPNHYMFSSFISDTTSIRINGVSHTLPEKFMGGDDPEGPISYIAEAIGCELTFGSGGFVRMIAGRNDVKFYIGDNKAISNGNEFEFGSQFKMKQGILYGPMKLFSQFANATLSRFDKAIVLYAPTIKGSRTSPELSVSKTQITYNSYNRPPGNERKATDFTLSSYPMSSGQKTTLSSVLAQKETKLVIIDFWATWCPPCKAAMPHLEKLWRKYKDKGLVVLGVITDNVTDDDIVSTLTKDNRIRSGLKDLGIDKITYPMCYDLQPSEKSISKNAYGVTSIPRLCVINKKMEWLKTEVGFWPQGMRSLEYMIRRLLGIEENANPPSFAVTNTGIGTLECTITSNLPFLKIIPDKFSTAGTQIVTVQAMSPIPDGLTNGEITIESNGGKSVIPVQFNPFTDGQQFEIEIDMKKLTTKINGRNAGFDIQAIVSGKTVLVEANQMLSALGGVLNVLPDKKRAVGFFEAWDIQVSSAKNEIQAGMYTFKPAEFIQIKGSSIFIDIETLCDILGAEFELKDGNQIIFVRYEL
jgi:thiol-disulfide isomerase/thioredoxin